MEDKIKAYFRNSLNLSVSQFPILLSSTNNLVYKVVTNSNGTYIFKIMRDKDIDVAFLRHCNTLLLQQFCTQRILHVDTSTTYFEHPVVLAEYLEGIDVAFLIENGLMTPEKEVNLGNFLYHIFRAVFNLELPIKGFGIYKLKQELQSSFDEFVYHYLDRYISRFVRLFETGSQWERYHTTLLMFYRQNMKDKPMEFGVISLDTNLKNIIFLENSDTPALLNLPILAYSEISHGIGEISSHITGTRTHKLFMKLIQDNFSNLPEQQYWICFFETLALIGTLAFICKQGRDAVESAVRWGYPIHFLTRIHKNIKILESAIF